MIMLDGSLYTIMSRRRYIIVIITGAAIIALFMAAGLVGCGGGDSEPAESAAATNSVRQSAGEETVEPAAGPWLGDMDSDGSPTSNDAQLIMNIVVDPDNEEYGIIEKWIADCEDPQAPSDVNTGDALEMLRAAAGEIDWPFSGGGPPPPPVPPPNPQDEPPPPPPI